MYLSIHLFFLIYSFIYIFICLLIWCYIYISPHPAVYSALQLFFHPKLQVGSETWLAGFALGRWSLQPDQLWHATLAGICQTHWHSSELGHISGRMDTPRPPHTPHSGILFNSGGSQRQLARSLTSTTPAHAEPSRTGTTTRPTREVKKYVIWIKALEPKHHGECEMITANHSLPKPDAHIYIYI